MRLPDGDGLDLVEWIQSHRPGVPVAVITAHGNVEAAVRALKLGAFDFISKPLDLGALRKLIAATLKLGELEETGRRTTLKLLGNSKPMQQLHDDRQWRARKRFHLGRLGPARLARAFIESGPRRRPFVPVNCGAIRRNSGNDC
jgi:two-component system response regulator PilR (NtrC family)